MSELGLGCAKHASREIEENKILWTPLSARIKSMQIRSIPAAEKNVLLRTRAFAFSHSQGPKADLRRRRPDVRCCPGNGPRQTATVIRLWEFFSELQK
jgi:hypothetical protein